ncbi:MAG: hypothetical protein ACXWQO_05195 [Bdellovibrionota bacterium]
MKQTLLALVLFISFIPFSHAKWTYLEQLSCKAENGVTIETAGAPTEGWMHIPVTTKLNGFERDFMAQWTTDKGSMGRTGEFNAIELANDDLDLHYVMIFDTYPIVSTRLDAQTVEGTLYRFTSKLFIDVRKTPLAKVICQVKMSER